MSCNLLTPICMLFLWIMMTNYLNGFCLKLLKKKPRHPPSLNVISLSFTKSSLTLYHTGKKGRSQRRLYCIQRNGVKAYAEKMLHSVTEKIEPIWWVFVKFGVTFTISLLYNIIMLYPSYPFKRIIDNGNQFYCILL